LAHRNKKLRLTRGDRDCKRAPEADKPRVNFSGRPARPVAFFWSKRSAASASVRREHLDRHPDTADVVICSFALSITLVIEINLWSGVEMSGEHAELDELQAAYKNLVEVWIAAIRKEEALASVNHDVADVDKWEQAHFEEDELRNKVKTAKEEYEDALRAKFFGF
jgi:hypothetical protein